MKRAFNKEYYDESKHAEKRVFGVLRDFFIIEECGDTFGEDVKIFDKNTREFLATGDIEVRFKWKEKYFPFYTIHIPIRKKKFMVNGNSFFYFVVNSDGTDCLVTDSDSILNSDIITLSLKYPDREVEEDFFDVPLSRWKQGFSQLPDYIIKKIREHTLRKKQGNLSTFFKLKDKQV